MHALSSGIMLAPIYEENPEEAALSSPLKFDFGVVSDSRDLLSVVVPVVDELILGEFMPLYLSFVFTSLSAFQIPIRAIRMSFSQEAFRLSPLPYHFTRKHVKVGNKTC